MDNDKLFDDILKEMADHEKTCAPADITEYLLQVISNLPEEHSNNKLLRRLRRIKFSVILKDVIEVAAFAFILFMIPVLITSHGKEDKGKSKNVAPSVVNKDIKTAILDTLSMTNINSIELVQGGPNRKIRTFLPDKDSDKIKSIINMIKSSSDVRVASKNELGALTAHGGSQGVTIRLKDGYVGYLFPTMQYDDRVLIIDYLGNSQPLYTEEGGKPQPFYTCFSKDLVDYLNSINKMINDETTEEFIRELQDLGYEIKTTLQNNNGVLSGPLTSINVKGETIGIYEYKDYEEMEQDAKNISSDGSMIGGTIYEWKSKSHFYKAGNIIVSYFGDNKEILMVLEKILGSQFAGN